MQQKTVPDFSITSGKAPSGNNQMQLFITAVLVIYVGTVTYGLEGITREWHRLRR